MQHLSTEDYMEKALLDLVASLPLETRLAGLEEQALRDLVATLPLETRLAGLPPEQRLAGLSPEAKEVLRKQLQGDDPSAPAK